MLNITIGTRTFQIPESWADLKTDARLNLIKFCGLETEKQARIYHEHIWQYFLILGKPSDMSPKQANEIWEQLKLDASQWHQMVQMISWVYNTRPTTLHEESIKIRGIKYYVTDAKLERVSALEIAWLNQAYIAICQATYDTSADAINELIAIICRPLMKPADLLRKADDPAWNGDRRRPLSFHELEKNKPIINLLPDNYKTLLLQYGTSLIESFVDEFDELFNQATPNGTIQPDFPQGAGWEAHLHRIAKEGTFGDYNQVCQTKARTIWIAEYLAYQVQKADIENAKTAQKEANK
jgi:hypothetical protein